MNNNSIPEDKKIIDTIQRVEYVQMHKRTPVPKSINNLLINSKVHNFSIYELRIILVILATLKARKKLIKGEAQLKLFDDGDGSVVSPHDETRFTFFLKDFLPKGSNHHDRVLRALKKLNAKTIDTNILDRNGKMFIHTSSIISEIIYSPEQRGMDIYLNRSWYKSFIDLSSHYNHFFTDIIFEVESVNSVTFYFYLKTLKEKGTVLSIKRINEIFNTNYSNWNKIKEKLLLPIKNDLDTNMDLSFNYDSIDLTLNSMPIVPYETNKTVPVVYNNEDYSIKKAMIAKRVKYKLSETEYHLLDDLYRRYSYKHVYSATARKKELKGLKSRDYVQGCSNLLKAHMDNLSLYEKNQLNQNYLNWVAKRNQKINK